MSRKIGSRNGKILEVVYQSGNLKGVVEVASGDQRGAADRTGAPEIDQVLQSKQGINA